MTTKGSTAQQADQKGQGLGDKRAWESSIRRKTNRNLIRKKEGSAGELCGGCGGRTEKAEGLGEGGVRTFITLITIKQTKG